MAVFTDDTLERLEAKMHEDPLKGFVAMWRELEPRWDDLGEGELRPGDYILPMGQAVRLIAALRKGARDNALDEFTFATGLWLNNGPATEETP